MAWRCCRNWLDMSAMRPAEMPAHGRKAYRYRDTQQYPGLHYDPADPLFAQYGEDARLATVERGESALGPLVEYLAQRVNRHLQTMD